MEICAKSAHECSGASRSIIICRWISRASLPLHSALASFSTRAIPDARIASRCAKVERPTPVSPAETANCARATAAAYWAAGVACGNWVKGAAFKIRVFCGKTLSEQARSRFCFRASSYRAALFLASFGLFFPGRRSEKVDRPPQNTKLFANSSLSFLFIPLRAVGGAQQWREIPCENAKTGGKSFQSPIFNAGSHCGGLHGAAFFPSAREQRENHAHDHRHRKRIARFPHHRPERRREWPRSHRRHGWLRHARSVDL